MRNLIIKLLFAILLLTNIPFSIHAQNKKAKAVDEYAATESDLFSLREMEILIDANAVKFKKLVEVKYYELESSKNGTDTYILPYLDVIPFIERTQKPLGIKTLFESEWFYSKIKKSLPQAGYKFVGNKSGGANYQKGNYLVILGGPAAHL